MPHGLCDQLRRRVVPGAFVNTTSVHKAQLEALAAHKSQQHWLDVSQGIELLPAGDGETWRWRSGRMSKRFKCAEGWRRHLHLGFCGADADPLREALGRTTWSTKPMSEACRRAFDDLSMNLPND